MLRATSHLPAGHGKTTFDQLVLEHDERRLRRKLVRLSGGDEVLVDFAQTATLAHRGALALEDGRFIAVLAAAEPLYEVRGRDPGHLVQLAWHIGNRHTSAQLEDTRILIKRDHVLKTMLEGLGATIDSTTEPFFPEYGAYHSHGEPSHALLNR